MEAEAGQTFIIPQVTARNLSSHIPETPNPMISTVTTDRVTMTVVKLHGGKRKDNITVRPTSFTPYTAGAGRGLRWVSHSH